MRGDSIKNYVSKVFTQMENLSFTLKQIANWTNPNSEVTIPALQRGLVWKPNQVELLWDSILRGFPIGSFMLADVVNSSNKEKYYLLDGQQRYNAISLGFNSVPNPRSILWLDLCPPKKTTRTFWIKATTIAHPWGFKNDDVCTRLNTSEKRSALERFHLKGNIYNNGFSLNDTWPVEATKPIPLYCFLNATLDNEEAFLNSVMGLFMDSQFSYKNIFPGLSDKDKEYIRESLYPVFENIKNYSINCNHLTKEVLSSETEDETSEQTALETLFTRLNTGGTVISRDDLNYSAIKAYWPSIKDINDKISEGYMSPSKLVMLAFRLALTSRNDKNIHGELSIKQIRQLAKDDKYNKERGKINNLYNSGQLEVILKKVDHWLDVDNPSCLMRTPTILRTNFSYRSNQAYLFLMFLAQREIKDGEYYPKEYIKALAFLIHWFSLDKSRCVQEFFQATTNRFNLERIRMGISSLQHDGYILPIYTPDEFKKALKISDSPNWRVFQNVSVPVVDTLWRVFNYSQEESKEMLLYAEREYLNSHFSLYNPAMTDMWEEYNRPWDYDHIIPQDWIRGARGADYRDYDRDNWLNCIGNISAISYEINRSKSNREEYGEYEINKESLFFDSDFENIGHDLPWNKDTSYKFGVITFTRFLRIYSEIYNVIRPLVIKTVLPPNLEARKVLMSELLKFVPNASIYYADRDNNYCLISRPEDWSRTWIGIGVKKGVFIACFEWSAEYNDEQVPNNSVVGIRASSREGAQSELMSELKGQPADSIPQNNMWYIFEECKSMQSQDISELINKYVKLLPS